MKPAPARPKSPTIRANVLASVVAELIRQGADAERLLREHIEGVDAIRNPYQEVPLDRYVAFFEAAAEAAGDPAFGARIGARFQAEDLGPLGVVFVAAPSLQAALNRLGFFLETWQGGTTAELEVGDDTAEWIYQIDDPQLQPRRQDAEFSLSATCGFIRALLGPRWSPLEVHLEHSAPAGGTPGVLGAIFKAPILYEQGVNRLVFDRLDLVRPVSSARQAIAPYLEQHLRDLLGNGRSEERMSDQVSYLVAKRMGRQPLDLPSLANELGVSNRTLQRRLTEEGTSLRELVRRHRARVAEPLLGGGTPITSIAHSVGYADATVFARAFRAWKGDSPRAFRRRASQG